MCGIAGFIGSGTEENLRAMIHSIAYRGPDFQGTFLENGVGLAQARLSIIDLSAAAHQPFFSSDRKIGLVFNGEIYNFESLKEALLRTGKYQFRTTSDTEVLVYLYQEYGPAMLPMLNGMFAFALWDFEQRQLFVARDRMGKKPLFYSLVGENILFGSELKAIEQHPLCKSEINLHAVNEYLTFEYVPTPHTIINGIQKLEPGTYFVWENGKIIQQQAYHTIDFHRTETDFGKAVSHLDNLLEDATKLRMISDVPLGVFLSGGLDSSIIAYYAQKLSSAKVKTFSIGFSEKSYDESEYAAAVAKQLGTEHYSKILTAKDTLDLLDGIYKKLDEPFADASLIPTHLLSCFTREQVTVALGGDGSDELLAGYPTFQSERMAGLFSNLPRFVHSSMKGMANLLPTSDKNISFDFKVKQFLRGFEAERKHVSTLWLGAFLPSEKQKLLSGDVQKVLLGATGLEVIDQWLSELPQGTRAFNRLLYTYYRTYLLDDILMKVDRASMYTSLEVRSPFLDYRVVDYISGLPDNFKIKGMTTKYILKKLARGKIPDMIIDRPKKGFGIPLSHWLKHELRGLCEDLLSKESLGSHGFFNHQYVHQLMQDHFSGKANYRKQLWVLMVFQMWWLRRQA